LGHAVPKGLKRYYGHGHLHFLTFRCYRHLPLLKTVRARHLFVHKLAQVRAGYAFGGAKIGGAPEGFALEQLVVLRER
jgi:hypothetical protein